MSEEKHEVKTIEKKKEHCEFCNETFWNLGAHQRGCEEKKEFDDCLEENGIVIRSSRFLGDEIIYVSGGMQVILILRGRMTTEEYLKQYRKGKERSGLKLIKNLLEFETENNIRLEHNDKEDKLYLKKV